MQGLDEVMRLKKTHSRWMLWQSMLGMIPVFALVNRFRPILTDGYGRDLIPSLLPEGLAEHYNLILGVGLAGLTASELLRRRFHSRHKEDLAL